jgi:type I restriction enzyme R subunit
MTYKSEGSVNQHIADFRSDPAFRIAVSVDQIGTGTNVKPIECLVFMRMVGSRVLLNQMRGSPSASSRRAGATRRAGEGSPSST